MMSEMRALRRALATMLAAGALLVAIPATPAAAAPTGPTTAPQGNWVGAYGSQGYLLGGWNAGKTDLGVLPPGVTFTLDQGSRYCGTCPSTETRALQAPDKSERRAATWFHNTQLTMHLTFTAAFSGNLHLYALDRNSTARRENITVDDGTTKQVLALSSAFDQGAWTHFPVTIAAGGGIITITADKTGGDSAVLSGIFLGDAGPPLTTTTSSTTTTSPSTTTTSSSTTTTSSSTTTTSSSSTTTSTTTPTASATGPTKAPQGTWVGAYGSGGYVLGGWNSGTSDLESLPPAVTFTLDQGSRNCGTCPSTETRALQAPDASERRAANWYHNTQLKMHLTFSGAYSGNLHLYALDRNSTTRRESIAVNDGTTNQVLALSAAFDQGAWTHFPVTIGAGGGTITITITKTGGDSAVLSGIFLGDAGPPFTPGPPPYSSAPQGSWIGTYGSNGYVLGAWNLGQSDVAALPAGATATLDHGLRTCWNCHTTDVRALQDPVTSSQRRAATWYDPTQLRAHLTFPNGYSGNLYLYAVDWDKLGRREKITVTAGASVQTIAISTAFDQGAWLTFPVTVGANGTVAITVDKTVGVNAVLSGVFLGGAGTPPAPPPPPPAYTSAPQGTWVNTYGVGGYSLGGFYGPTNSYATDDLTGLPSGVTRTLVQGERWCWLCPSGASEPRGLQSPDAKERHAAAWFHTQLRLRLNFSSSYTGTLHVYAIDFDALGRREKITVTDSVGPQAVDLTTDFSQGAWIALPITVSAGGNVTINADRTAGANAVVSGLFLGDAGPPLIPPAPAVGQAPAGAWPGTVQMDVNPDPAINDYRIWDAPDPSVLAVSPSFCAPDNGGAAPAACYYTYTTMVVYDPVPVWRSSDLVHWHMAGKDGSDSNPYPDGSSIDPNTFSPWSEYFERWAPAVFQHNGQYVMWYSAKSKSSQLHCIAVATASTPNGPFQDANGPFCKDSQGGVIDPSPFIDTDLSGFLVYKTEGTSSQPPRIYSAPLITATSIGSQTQLLQLSSSWEQPRIEAPTLWRAWSGLFLFYSGGNWEDASYAVGVARCNTPKGPCTRSYTNPVLGSRGSAVGPGGQTPFIDASGSARMEFHAWQSDSIGYGADGERSLRFLPLAFPNGNPKIG